jgi:MoxR-like ATPase
MQPSAAVAVHAHEDPPAPDINGARQLAVALLENLSRVIRGKPEALRLAVAAVLSGGHLLIEDVPGHGKTLLAKALACSVGGTFRRIQATPDLLPSELTGVSVFHKASETWEFRPGPLFANVVLTDEVNRATPRSQSALLEAMEERQVSVDGTSHLLPTPFVLIATQNPFDHAGTFPLLEGQRDRFAVVLALGHPGRDAERDLLLGLGGVDALVDLPAVTDPAGLARAIAVVRQVHCAPAVADYIIDIGAGTRAHHDVRLGASPRAALALLHAAQANAMMAGRRFLVPDDVKALAAPVLAHRLVLTGGSDATAGRAIVRQVVESVPVPRG